MSTALQTALYNTHVGVDYLSRNVESNVLHAPEVLDRLSISQRHFDAYKTRTYRPPHAPWGRSLSYGGTGPINLPDQHRPKQEPPTRVQKGHRHFGGGVVPIPCNLPIQQYYDLTLLKKSNLRRNDELIPDPHKLDIGKHAIQLKFPSEHPYHSHIPKCALFPNFDSPDDVRKGKNVIMTSSTLPPTAAASAPDPVVVQKTKGHFARREIVQVQNESRKDPLIWNEHNYYQEDLEFTTQPL
ncbi:uncharacterized protein C7orf31 [Exaiptasia diaphana]|uniref:Uncharacterized protein n=1 Tax=Exaiptasia diaphana TaxID=2652724 RepID=A0A913WR66_EXADI|nr:uncharacterized protein C7orf31 [Exaiptasia diaphana]